VKAEIIDGSLVTLPSPRPRHANVQGALRRFIGGPFHDDDGFGGPGGWWIFIDVDVALSAHTIVRPDVVGVRRERLPDPDVLPIPVVPDWICEVLSPSNEPHDRVTKRRLYVQHGVRWYWIVDPATRILEAFELRDPPLLGREVWKREEEARINAEIARQVGQAQERAQKLAELAQGNTAAAERVKTLQKQLHTAEGLKQGHFGELQTLRQESTTTAQALDSMAVAYVQGGNLGKFREYGELVREQTR